ncbi:hypothetical protein F5Y11DRAFT_247884 [Daldinia sp. FL1419]|nr:hypothetical protein F5Y11DRAFT_247884 [Daldinia sp. FL1419]
MSPALASRCRRVANRHICPQNDSIWISEALLAAAFDRYCVGSRAVARYGSSVPGPMENKRRMGKRHMVELNSGHLRSASPLWGLENLADLTQWRWKPPSPRHTRLRHHQDKSAEDQTLAKSMLDWFSKSTHDSSIATGEVVTQPLLNSNWDAHTTPTEIIDTGLNSLFRDLESEATTTRPNFAGFCRTWSNHLTSDFYPGDLICTVLEGIRQGIDMSQAGIGGPMEWAADRIKLDLLDATIVGISDHTVYGENRLDGYFWCDLLQRISELQINSMRILSKAMDRIPEVYLGEASAGVLANLHTYLIASGSSRKRSAVIRQATRMAKILGRLNLSDYRFILENGTQHVLAHRESTDVYFPRMRLGWLQLLARLSSVDDQYLIKTANVLEAGRDIRPLSNRGICEMYLARCRPSVEHFNKLHNVLERTRGKDSTCYGYFGMALWETNQFGLAKGLCKFLKELGREQDIMKFAKGMRIFIKSEVTPLVNIAIGIGDPVLAIDLLNLYREGRVESKRNADTKSFWDTHLSTDTLKTLTRNRSFRHYKVLSALRVKQLPARQTPIKFPTKRKLVKNTRAATKAVMTFAMSHGISPRQSFALISRCIAYLQSRRGLVVPVPALRALLHNITRDLAEGKPGRVTRLRWFLSLLDRHVGREKMLTIGLALRRWRIYNARHRCRSIG